MTLIFFTCFTPFSFYGLMTPLKARKFSEESNKTLRPRSKSKSAEELHGENPEIDIDLRECVQGRKAV